MKRAKSCMAVWLVLAFVLQLLYGSGGMGPFVAMASNEEEEITDVYEKPSNGAHTGETLKFVNLYWETDDLGEVEAVFDSGTIDPIVLPMKRRERGVYAISIPEGDYLRVGFRQAGKEAFLSEKQWNLYEKDGASFQSVLCNTFYYDLGDHPSYWGADPQKDVDEVRKLATKKAKATWQPGDPYEVEVKPQDMVYLADLATVDGGETKIKRVNIAFLPKNHKDDWLETGEGEAYTMYERMDGVYSAPFPPSVNEKQYSEIAFQLVGRDGNYLERHYNFRGDKPTDTGEKWGYFQYKPGYVDAFYLNLLSGTEQGQMLDASYWGCHPSMANDSLDTEVFYVDVTDYTGNGVMADIDNLYIRWNGMKEGLIPGAAYDQKKGYQITKGFEHEKYRYFQFPYNSGVLEQTVLTLTFSIKDDPAKKEYEYKFIFVPKSGKNCIQLDNIGEFNGQMWKHFHVDISENENRTVFFNNKRTEYEKIYARIAKDPQGKQFASAEDLTKAGLIKGKDFFVEPSGAYLLLTKIVGDEANKYNKVNAYKLSVPGAFPYIQFRGHIGKKTYYSNLEEISTKFNSPCYYAGQTGKESGRDPGASVEHPGISGFWRSIYSTDTTGDKMVEIPNGDFVREEGTYYTTTTFYDYYSTLEMNGVPLKDAPGMDHDTYVKLSSTFNQATEDYYKKFFKNEDEAKDFQAVYMTENGINYWHGNHGINRWTGANGGPFSKIASKQLQDGNIFVGNSSIVMPFFNEKFLRGENSLGTAVGNVYKNVQFPFTKDTDPASKTYGYWVYNSARKEDAVRLSYDVDYGYFLDRTKKPITFKNLNSFFPFSDHSVSGGADERNKEKMNNMFGVRFAFDFQLTENQQVYNEYTKKEEPIRFEFQGDDDTWIYIDDYLALDLGGIHDAVRGEINFKDGTYTIWRGIKDKNNSYDGAGTIQETNSLPKAVLEALKKQSSHKLTMFYMERGMYESNLKLTFNFPRESKLTVGKEVDITTNEKKEEPNMFTSLLGNMGGFPFQLQNLVTSGGTLPVQSSAGYISPGKNRILYNKDNRKASFAFASGEAGTITGDHPKKVVQKAVVAGAEPDGKNLLKISPEGYLNIKDMSYMRLAMKNTGANDTSAKNLYLAFEDGNGHVVGGYAGTLGYGGETNSFLTNADSILRIDFKKMTASNKSQMDWSMVKHMYIGVRRSNEGDAASYEIQSIAFFEAFNKVPTGGFSVTDEQISDYGSYESKKLTPVDQAWYVCTNKKTENEEESSMSRQTDKGHFSLADGQRAIFSDKFRTGSYIALEEVDMNPKIFDTTWTIKENGKEICTNDLLYSRDDVTTVENPLTLAPEEETALANISGTAVGDGRKENISKSWPNYGSIQVPADVSKTIVYRSYKNPDLSSNISTDLSVEVKNTLKYGSITIEKVLKETSDRVPSDYFFDIYYVDVAGRALELQLSPVYDNNRFVRQTVKVHVDETGKGSATAYNIPAGTTYYIVERPANGAKLVDIDLHPEEVTEHENVTMQRVTEENGQKDFSQAFVQGVAYASNKTVTFTNKLEPFYMDIEKRWNDGLTDEKRKEMGISEIRIQLQRRVAGDPFGAWENVTKDYFDTQVGDAAGCITLTAPDWKVRSKTALPYKPEVGNQLYEYRIQEMDEKGVLKNYDVSYEELRNPDLTVGGTSYLHVTYQAVNTMAGIDLVKKWDDNENVGDMRPEKIRVKLVGGVDPKGTNWKCYKSLKEEKHTCTKECYIELSEQMAWHKIIKNLRLQDENGKPYYYQLANEEIYEVAKGETGVWVPVESFTGTKSGYQVTYGEPQIPQGQNAVTISATNKVEFGNIAIEKKDKETKASLEGVKFQIQRLIEEENDKKETWKVDAAFSPREAATSATGRIEWKSLPYGTYRITETETKSGYVRLKKPIEVTINDKEFENQAKEHAGDVSYDASKKLITITIFNVKALTIPETGGRGVKWFVIGGLLLCGAGIVLYGKNRKKRVRRAHSRRRR